MTTPNYLNFSRVGGRERLNEAIDTALDLLDKIQNAPEAAKPALMESDYKVAVTKGAIVKTVIQGESANRMINAIESRRISGKLLSTEPIKKLRA